MPLFLVSHRKEFLFRGVFPRTVQCSTREKSLHVQSTVFVRALFPPTPRTHKGPGRTGTCVSRCTSGSPGGGGRSHPPKRPELTSVNFRCIFFSDLGRENEIFRSHFVQQPPHRKPKMKNIVRFDFSPWVV